MIEPHIQKDVADCGVACLAMLCGVSFETAMMSLPKTRRRAITNVEGMSVRQMCRAAKRMGRPLIWVAADKMAPDAIGIMGLSRPVDKSKPGGNAEGHYVIYVRGTIWNPADGMWWMEADAFFKTRRWEPDGVLVRVEETA